MATVDVNKITNTLSDAVKLAANLSENVKEKKDMQHISDDSNNNQSNPNQQVQIHIGEQDSKKKEEPVVIHEKPETHIHKEFPDDRALSDKECDLALAKAKMENDYKNKELEYRQYRAEQERRDRIAKEELERKDREERRIREEKKAKIRGIIGAVLGVLGAAGLGYCIYSDARSNKSGAIMPATNIAINSEGTVE